MNKNQLLGGLFGLCVGDALGVPVEFRARSELRAHPVKDMTGDTEPHRQPPGTWSDDSSLAFCLAESLAGGYDLKDTGERFVRFLTEAYWTPYGVVFDVGGTTKEAIQRLKKNPDDPSAAGGREEFDNGNGSLMRILPLAFTLGGLPFEERVRRVAEVSSITHAHRRAVLGCVLYVETALRLLAEKTPRDAYRGACALVRRELSDDPELSAYLRLVGGEIAVASEDSIKSGGYVVDTAEAAVWCLLTENNYTATVLKAVNLGDDTDTTAAAAGGLAGIYYGLSGIPERWRERLARRDDIEALGERLWNGIRAAYTSRQSDSRP